MNYLSIDDEIALAGLRGAMLTIVNSEFFPIGGMTLKAFLTRCTNIYPINGSVENVISALGWEPDDIVTRPIV